MPSHFFCTWILLAIHIENSVQDTKWRPLVRDYPKIQVIIHLQKHHFEHTWKSFLSIKINKAVYSQQASQWNQLLKLPKVPLYCQLFYLPWAANLVYSHFICTKGIVMAETVAMFEIRTEIEKQSYNTQN